MNKSFKDLQCHSRGSGNPDKSNNKLIYHYGSLLEFTPYLIRGRDDKNKLCAFFACPTTGMVSLWLEILVKAREI